MDTLQQTILGQNASARSLGDDVHGRGHRTSSLFLQALVAFMIVGTIWAACFATLLDLLLAGLASGSGQGATFWREPRG